MNRLLEIGFVPVGHWQHAEGRLICALTRHATQKNVLYAFACDGEIKYIGKSKSSLATRMSQYRNPASSQSTNVRNNQRITEILSAGGSVDIYALPDSGLLHYGRFHLNLAAGLEDDLIRVIDPPWNGGGKEVQTESAETEVPLDEAFDFPVTPSVGQEPQGSTTSKATLADSFTFVLHPTYSRTGFFNVGVAAQALLGADGEVIEIFCGEASAPLLGTINRTANRNGTPRIMGGTGLRDWFEVAASPLDVVTVDVLSPTAIRLRLGVR